MAQPFQDMKGEYKDSKPDTIYKQAIAPYVAAGGQRIVTPQNQVYTTTGVVADRDLSDPAAITTTELGHVLGTLIADLKASGIIR